MAYLNGNGGPQGRARAVWIAVPLLTWLAVTSLSWTGYTGEDDLFYARYAFLLHRPPIVWWEFRMPAILAIRTSFLLFGPTEFAAALPSLLASLAILASVAWFVDWPRTITWRSEAAMLLAAIIPIDVGFRSYPSAPQIAAGLIAVGTVLMLKGGKAQRIAGAAALALAFITHEVTLFYVGLFCLIALAFDWRRFGPAVAWCVALAAALSLVECTVYWVLLGDPLARLHVAAGSTSSYPAGFDPDTGLSGWRFYAWPLQNIVLTKQFGSDLLLLFVSGLLVWRRLGLEQRILFVTVAAVFLWLGYGTLLPWKYSPLARQYHFYNSLTFGIAALLPFTVASAFARRAWAARFVVAAALLIHVLSLGIGGRWGAAVDVSRELLTYARQHPQQQFLTDVNTLNQMYVLNGFTLPDNVICRNGPAVDQHLLLNKEPPGTPKFHFDERPVDALLVNWEVRGLRGFEPEFAAYLDAHAHDSRTVVSPVRYRPPFVPLIRFMEPRSFMVQSAAGEAVAVAGGA